MSSSKLSHLDERGGSRMVDVSAKATTERRAVAHGRVTMHPETMSLIREGRVEKGNALEVARVAGIMAAKRTSELIPMCHPLSITSVNIRYEFEGDDSLLIESEVKVADRTGVEMEALTAVSVCALTVYDMCKSVDRDITIKDIHLAEKSGGKSGHYRR